MNEAASLAPVCAAVACGSEAVFPRRWQPRPGQGASGPLRQPGVTAGRLPRLVLRRRSARQDVSPVTAIPGSLTPRILNRTSGVRFEPPPPSRVFDETGRSCAPHAPRPAAAGNRRRRPFPRTGAISLRCWQAAPGIFRPGRRVRRGVLSASPKCSGSAGGDRGGAPHGWGHPCRCRSPPSGRRPPHLPVPGGNRTGTASAGQDPSLPGRPRHGNSPQQFLSLHRVLRTAWCSSNPGPC